MISIRLMAHSVLCFGVLSAPFMAFARADQSDLIEVKGLKFPESDEFQGFDREGLEDWGFPVEASTVSPLNSNRFGSAQKLGGYSELVEFILPSPHQEDAGSCLYMSLTGIAEWWLAKLNPRQSRALEGPMDLSERYLMNLADQPGPSNLIQNWKTDSIMAFNFENKAALNRDYRYTKGWYRSAARGSGYEPAAPNSFGAEYGTPYNWINGLPNFRGAPVKLPNFRRYVLFADPASDQWNVGVMPATIVETVKSALRRNRAPVHVLYNHYGYWHANIILGFDDNQRKEGCTFVTRFREQQVADAKKAREQAAQANDPQKKKELLGRASKYENTVRKFDASWGARGGCKNRGVFYVRDSIYDDPSGPVYDYDRSRAGEESAYSQKIVLLEYEWLEHMANHAVQILAE